MYKTVLMPIQVPSSDYCWDGHHVCVYFDNSVISPGVCGLGFYDLKYDGDHKVPKSEKCEKLKSQ